MAAMVDLKSVVKHLVDGTFNGSLCRICLLPLGDVFENIFTQICKEDQEYCIADVLETVCQIKFSPADDYSVCSDCFVMASTAFKLNKLSKRSEEILNFYVDELEKNVYSVEVPEDISSDSLCITLPEYAPITENFDCNIDACLIDECFTEHSSYDNDNKIELSDPKPESLSLKNKTDETNYMVIVIDEMGQRSYYKMNDRNTLELVPKIRRKRGPMKFTKCSRCPVKYKFLNKLKKHMKTVHNTDLYICKICKTVTEDMKEFDMHLSMHKSVYCCDYCNTAFKNRETIISHLKWHETMNVVSDVDMAHVCELCGTILQDEEQLNDHYDKKHDKKFTCFYCGKTYKGQMSCENHIRKHEMHEILKEKRTQKTKSVKEDKGTVDKPELNVSKSLKKRIKCDTCGKDFVDERALLWHSMLHTNERPYTCDECGRGFISVNRRNQHVLCAHTMPTKRCPLCPALFHLRSMVNTHIKKVHLKVNKRSNRTSKHENMCVYWRTERVPIQELSVSIQSEILHLQTMQPAQLKQPRDNTLWEAKEDMI